MKWATCGKASVAKSLSISFRLVGRKEGSGVVCPGAASSGERLDGIARNGPTSQNQFSSSQLTNPKQATTNSGKPTGKLKRTTLRRFEETAFSKSQPMTYGNPNHQPAED